MRYVQLKLLKTECILPIAILKVIIIVISWMAMMVIIIVVIVVKCIPKITDLCLHLVLTVMITVILDTMGNCCLKRGLNVITEVMHIRKTNELCKHQVKIVIITVITDIMDVINKAKYAL